MKQSDRDALARLVSEMYEQPPAQPPAQPPQQGQAPVAPQGQAPPQEEAPLDLNTQFPSKPAEIGNLLNYIVEYGRDNKIVNLSPITQWDNRKRDLANYSLLSDKGFAWHPSSNESEQITPDMFKYSSGYSKLQQLAPSLAQQQPAAPQQAPLQPQQPLSPQQARDNENKFGF